MHPLVRPPRRLRRTHRWFRAEHIALSRSAHAALDLAEIPLRPFLFRHEHGDWGLLRDADAAENDHALQHGGPIVSEYELPTGQHILCLTTADRRLTSVLCPTDL